MPIIINELDIVSEPLPEPAAPAALAGRDSSQGKASNLSPHSLSEILRQQRQRLDRLRAH